MASRRAIGHWLILLLLSVLFSSLLLRIHLPAALLLGPLIAGLILSLRGVKLSIPRPCYLAAQAIVGCMIARAINPSVFGVLFNNWALVLAILLTTLAISGLTGWLLVRYSALPGATGAWGSSPGGASAMVVMAQEYGADVRLVALMQYLRVLFVVGAAALVVRYALGNEAQEMTQDIVWFPSLTLNFPFTLLLTAVACWLGMRLRIPSGAMLLPMLLGALAQGGGWLMLELPEWLLAMAYAVLGWTVGLQFNKAIFLLALKTLPQIIASIIGLILTSQPLLFDLPDGKGGITPVLVQTSKQGMIFMLNRVTRLLVLCSYYSFALTQLSTLANAAGSAAASVPPACAMSGRPPPLPPTC